jgi:hypothetical protein
VPPADPSVPGTGHCYLLQSLYFKPQWTLLQTLPLCHATLKSGVSYRPFILWDRRFLLKTLYFVTADTGLCLLQTLHTATQWTLESPTDPLLGVTVDTSVSSADPIHCGTGISDVSCRPYTLWHSGHWSLLQALYLVSQWTHWCLLERLQIVAKGTMMSPANPIHCGIADNGVSSRPSTWCHSGHLGVSWKSYTLCHTGTMMSPADPTHCGMGDNDVSCRPYTLWHSGHWSLLQTLCIAPHYFDMYSCCCQISARYKCQGRVSAAVSGNCNTHQHF